MTWWTAISVAPTAPLPPSTAGLILVDAQVAPYTITLPLARLASGRLYFCRADARANVVSLLPQGGDVITPTGAEAPSLALTRTRNTVALVSDGQATWRALQSAMPEIVRESAVAALIDYGTLAGAAIESERIDPVQPGDTPRLIVFSEESAESTGEPALRYDVTQTLEIQVLIERARKADAVATLDTLIAQVKDALFGDPVWVSLTEDVPSARVTRKFEGLQEQIIGDARIVLTCKWSETYPPRVTTPLVTVTATTQPPAGTQSIAIIATLPQN